MLAGALAVGDVAAAGGVYIDREPPGIGIWLPLAYMHCM
jgi:hypothetical protein